MTRSLLLSTLLLAGAANAQVVLPVQGFLTDAGVAVVGNQDFEFRLVNDQGDALSCEPLNLELNAGFFTALLGQQSALGCLTGETPLMFPAIFAQPLSLEVSLGDGTVLGLFPLGDAPRAGFAAVAARVVDELPNVVRADDSAALEAALEAAGATPTVIELGAGTYTLPGQSTIPKLTDLRGKGAFTTILSTNALRVSGNNRISGLSIVSPVQNDAVTLALSPAPQEIVELIDVRVVARPPTGLGIPIVIDEISDVTSRVILRDVELNARSTNFVALGIVDEQGVSLELTDTTIQVEAATEAIGIRVGLGAAFAADFALRVEGGTIDVTGSTPVVGVETFAQGGAGELRALELRSSGIALSVNGGQLTARDARISADVLTFTNPQGNARFARSGIKANTVSTGSNATQCILSWNEDTLTPVTNDCTTP